MKSNCCQAEIETQYGDEGTNYWTCSKCKKACDPYVEKSISQVETRKHIAKLLKELSFPMQILEIEALLKKQHARFTQDLELIIGVGLKRFDVDKDGNEILPDFHVKPQLWSERNARNHLRSEQRERAIKKGYVIGRKV